MAITYEPITHYTFSSAATSYVFTAIPQTYTDLVLVIRSQVATVNNSTFIRFNGDTGSNYGYIIMSGNSAGTFVGTRNVTDSRIFTDYYAAAPGTPNTNVSITNIQNYTNTTTFKSTLSRSAIALYGLDFIAGVWKNTAAITSITVIQPTYNFTTSTTMTLYGIKAA